MDRFLSRSPLLAGLITVWLFVLIGSFLASIVLNYTSIREETFPWFSYTINIAALIIGGWIAGRRSGRRGWYYGALTGLLYALIVFIIGMLAFDAHFSLNSLLQLFGAVVFGSLGGMLGVGTKKT